MRQIKVCTPVPHAQQDAFIDSPAKRKVIRAGRRGGKTVGVAIYAIDEFLEKRRVLYAAPTSDQVQRFWTEVSRALAPMIDAGIYKKNETDHTIEVVGTEQRIRAKTAWNADSLRGDYADVLILDEYQLMNEETWEVVGAPMLLDNDGDAVFIYTPPSLNSRSVSKARDPQHAAKLFRRAQANTTGRWETFHFGSADNPHISKAALRELASDMSALAIRQEIYAEDVDEAPGAQWTREVIERNRERALSAREIADQCDTIVVAIDPSATTNGDAAGIIVAGAKGQERERQGYVLADYSIQGAPAVWAGEVNKAATDWNADKAVAESNNGGEMVSLTLKTQGVTIPIKLVHASRGKQTRAEPVSVLYAQNRVHHCGEGIELAAVEDEMCLWTPGAPSPNRMDALVWALTELMLGREQSDYAPGESWGGTY